MGTTSSTPASRRTAPRFFEEATAHWIPLGRAHCEGCLRDDLDCWRRDDDANPTVYCEACLRRDHAAYLTEEKTVFATFDGIVKGLVEAGVPPRLIRSAVLEAIELAERREREQIDEMRSRSSAPARRDRDFKQSFLNRRFRKAASDSASSNGKRDDDDNETKREDQS